MFNFLKKKAQVDLVEIAKNYERKVEQSEFDIKILQSTINRLSKENANIRQQVLDEVEELFNNSTRTITHVQFLYWRTSK